jgi:hypothetical protein
MRDDTELPRKTGCRGGLTVNGGHGTLSTNLSRMPWRVGRNMGKSFFGRSVRMFTGRVSFHFGVHSLRFLFMASAVRHSYV